MSTIPRLTLAAVAAATITAAALAGCGTVTRMADQAAGHAITATPATTAVATPATGALRSIHFPGTVANDIPLSAGQCHVRVINGATGRVLPDAACTPGAIDPAVTQDTLASTICRSGYTATVRPPTSNTGRFKHESLVEYGMNYSKTAEYDHLVSLELGGSNSVSNLWPEPNRAHAKGVNNPKDAVENRL